MKDFCFGLCKFVGNITLSVVAIYLRLYVLVALYTWFILSAFNLSTLNMIQIWGVAIFWGLFNIKPADFECKQKLYQQYVMGIFASLLYWGMGYLIHLCM
jgi:hypothetical protein